jgi:hypothetical protein
MDNLEVETLEIDNTKLKLSWHNLNYTVKAKYNSQEKIMFETNEK